MSFVVERKGREGRKSPLWEEVTHRKQLMQKLEKPVRTFFDESVRPLKLGFDFSQESVVWQHVVPGWANGPQRLDLEVRGRKKVFPFSLSDLDAWVFPGGLVILVPTLEPAFPVTRETAGMAAELLVRVAAGETRFSRKFRNRRDEESTMSRLRANEDSMLFSGLCGADVRLRELMQSVVPKEFVQTGVLRSAVFLRSPCEDPNEPLAREEVSRLVRMTTGLGGNAAISDGLVAEAVHDDGRENITFSVVRKGVGCWARAGGDDRFVGEGNFGRNWDYNFLPLYLLCVAQSLSLRKLEQQAAAALLQGQDLDELIADCSILETVHLDSPARVHQHNLFFQAARSALGIEESLQRIRAHRHSAPVRAAPSIPVRHRPRGAARLDPVITATAGWFVPAPENAYVSGVLPHCLGMELDDTLRGRIKSAVDSSSELRRSQYWTPIRDSDLTSELRIHRHLVKTWFPWMPRSWWRSKTSAERLHQAVMTVVGGHSNLAPGGPRPLSVAGAYIVLCNTVWHAFGKGDSVDCLDGCLIPSWEIVGFPRAPLMPQQQPDEAYTTLVHLERFFRDALDPEGRHDEWTNVGTIDFPEYGDGRLLEIGLKHHFDSAALGSRLGPMVNELLRGGHLPDLGPTSSALIHLHLAMLPCRAGVGTGGSIVLRDHTIKLYAGEGD